MDSGKLIFKVSSPKTKEGTYSFSPIRKRKIEKIGKHTTVFEYLKIQIERLKNAGRYRTSETYRQTLLSFMKFRKGKDLYYNKIDESLICEYESHMRIANLCRNTTSFYLRTFRSTYNRVVEDGLTRQNYPFKSKEYIPE